MVVVGTVEHAAVGQQLHVVGVVGVVSEVGAGRGVAGGDGPRGGGRVGGGGAQDLVLGAGAVEGELQTLVVRLQRVGAGLEGLELGLEVAHAAFLALAEGALPAGEGVSVQRREGASVEGKARVRGGRRQCVQTLLPSSRRAQHGEGATYAARFWALRRLWAGVRPVSFSSLLLRVLLARASSTSPPIPLSTLPTCIAGSGEPCVVARLWLKGKPSYGPDRKPASKGVSKGVSKGSCAALLLAQR